MNTAIANILNSALGEWIENLNADQLNLSVFRGDINLKNLKVKSDALTQLGIPYKVVDGFVGKLHVKIPWTSLTSSPLKVTLSDVMVRLKARPPTEWNEEKELQLFKSSKASSIKNYENVLSSELSSSQSDPGFVERLTTKIIDNLQVNLSNIYIRIEDDVSTDEPFSVGLAISSVVAATCNENWETEFVANSNTTYKLVLLEDIRVFMDYGRGNDIMSDENFTFEMKAKEELENSPDHKFILNPTSFRLEVVMNKNNKDLSLPQVSAKLTNAGIDLGIESPQVTNVFKLLDFMNQYNNFLKGVKSRIDEHEMSQEEANEYRQVYKTWRKTTSKKEQQKANQLFERLKSIEEKTTLNSILGNRKAANRELDFERREQKVYEQIEKIKSEGSGGWTSYIWGKSESQKKQEEEEKQKKIKEMEEKIREIQKEQGAFENEMEEFISDAQVFENLPAEYVRFLVMLNVSSVTLSIKDSRMLLLDSSLNSLELELGLRSESIYSNLKFESSLVKDNVVQSQAFPNLLKGEYLEVEFDQLPKTRLKMNSGGLELYGNLESILTVAYTYMAAVTEKCDLSRYFEAAQSKTQEYISYGQDYVQEFIKTGTQSSIELDVSLKAPLVFLPLDIDSLDKGMFVLDFGMLKASTQEEILEGNPYDKYVLTLDEMSTAICWNCPEPSSWKEGNYNYLVYPTTFSLDLMNSRDKNASTPGMILSTDLSAVNIEINKHSLVFSLNVMESALVTNSKHTPPNSAPQSQPQKQEVQRHEIEESTALKDRFKSIDEIMAVVLKVRMHEIKVKLVDEEDLAEFLISDFNTEVKLGTSGDTLGKLVLEKIDLKDLRKGIYFNSVICNPGYYNLDDEEFVDATEKTLTQLKVRFAYKPKQDFLDLQVNMSDMRIMPSPLFVEGITKFFTEQLSSAQRFSREIRQEQKPSEIQVERSVASRATTTFNTRVTFRLSNFEMWVPLDTKNRNARVGSFRFGVSTQYISSQTYTANYDSENNEISRDFKKIDDEASLEISHIGGLIGVVENNKVMLSQGRVDELLNPSRFIVSYRCVKQEAQDTFTKVDANLESMNLTVGFRDILFGKSIAEKWMALNLGGTSEDKKQESNQPAKPPSQDKMEFNLECDALQMTLIEDTGTQAYSLMHLSFSNLFSKAHMQGQDLKANFSTFIVSDFYNLKLAAWEPILEDWDFDLNYTQGSEKTEVEFAAPRVLNINMSYSMLLTVATLYKKLGQDTRFWEEESINQAFSDENEIIAHGQFMYNLKNKLGVRAKAWIDVPGDVEVWNLGPEESAGFGQHLIDNLYAGSKSKGQKMGILENVQAPAAICVEVEGFKPVRGLVIENLQTTGFRLESEEYNIECVIEIFSRKNERVVKIRSGHVCMNNTEIPITLQCEDQTYEVQPGTLWSLPLNWLLSKPVKVNSEEGPDSLFNEGVYKVNENFFVTTLQQYKTESKVPEMFYMLNPSYVVQNVLPCWLSVFANDSLEPLCVVSPGSKESLMTLDPSQNPKFKFSMRSEEIPQIQTDWTTLEAKETHINMEGDFPADQLTVEKLPLEIKKTKNIDLRFRKEINQQERGFKSVLLDVYTQFVVVNKTNISLEVGRKTMMKVGKFSKGFFKSGRGELRVRASGEEYGVKSEWSEGFNIKTTGVSGLVTLKNSEAVKLNKEAPDELWLGVYLAEAPPPLVKSKIVYIVPRFVVTNYLSHSVFVKQQDSAVTYKLEKGQVLIYQFENPKKNKKIQVSRDGEQWSCPFSIQEICDFQLKYPGREDEKTDQPENWYEPSPKNNFSHVSRLLVTSEDEATLHISFLYPKDPEFSVYNFTSTELTICQENNPQVTVPPQEEVPWVFDDVSQQPKKLVVKQGQTTQTYSIEKIKKMKNLGNNLAEVIVNGVTRQLRVWPKRASIDLQSAQVPVVTSKMVFLANIKGVGVSIIDNSPNEILYASLLNIRTKAKLIEEKKGTETSNIQKLDFKLGEFQLDNMRTKGKLYPVIFCPAFKATNEEPVPFIQTKVHRVSTVKKDEENQVTSASIDKFSWLELLVQEIVVKVNQELISVLLEVTSQATEAFGADIDSRQTMLKRGSTISETFPELNTECPKLNYNPSQSSNKMYFEFVRFWGMKINISFKTAQKTVEFQLDPKNGFGVFRILSTVGGAFINISNSPLYFKELIFQHSFQSMNEMSWLIIKNYTRQGIMQFYKLIGSSDLIGNPIGLIDTLGSGVVEFFSAPVKGALKGPKGFASGVSKGMRSLVGNVVSGAFGSVSRITGSLHGVVKQVSGADVEDINQSDSMGGTILGGFKGAGSDIAQGVTGIFTKPWKGAKQEGAKGFVKGIGKGLWGALTSPVTAVLRVGAGLTSGVAQAGTLLAKGKISVKGRNRFPRHFSPRKVLEPYNQEVAEAQELLKSLSHHRKEKMVFYQHLTENKEDIIIILTMKNFLFLVNGDLYKQFSLKSINRCELHRIKNNFCLVIGTSLEEFVVKSVTMSSLVKLYYAFNSLPTSISYDQNLRKIKVPKRYGAACCGR